MQSTVQATHAGQQSSRPRLQRRAWRGHTWWQSSPGPRCPTGTPACPLEAGAGSRQAKPPSDIPHDSAGCTPGQVARSGTAGSQQPAHSGREPGGTLNVCRAAHQAVGGGGQGDLLVLLLLKRQVHAAAVAGRGAKKCVRAQPSAEQRYACQGWSSLPTSPTRPDPSIQRTRCSGGLQQRRVRRGAR